MEFCDQSWNYTNFVSEFYQICTLFADLEKFSISLESPHFWTFSAKCANAKFWQRDDYGKIMVQSFSKSVGTLNSFVHVQLNIGIYKPSTDIVVQLPSQN